MVKRGGRGGTLLNGTSYGGTILTQLSLSPNVHNMTAQYPPFHVLYSHDGIEEDQSEETDEECYFESSSRGG